MQCLFISLHGHIILLLHVNDIIITPTNIQFVKTSLEQQFEIKDLGPFDTSRRLRLLLVPVDICCISKSTPNLISRADVTDDA